MAASLDNTELITAFGAKHDSALLRELATAATEFTAYLKYRRRVDERRRSFKIAVIVFFVSLFASAAVTRMHNHASPKRDQRTGIIKVENRDVSAGRSKLIRF